MMRAKYFYTFFALSLLLDENFLFPVLLFNVHSAEAPFSFQHMSFLFIRHFIAPISLAERRKSKAKPTHRRLKSSVVARIKIRKRKNINAVAGGGGGATLVSFLV